MISSKLLALASVLGEGEETGQKRKKGPRHSCLVLALLYCVQICNELIIPVLDFDQFQGY